MEQQTRNNDRPALYVYILTLLYFLASCYASLQIAMRMFPHTTSPGQEGHIAHFICRFGTMGLCVVLFMAVGVLVGRGIIRHLPPPKS